MISGSSSSFFDFGFLPAFDFGFGAASTSSKKLSSSLLFPAFTFAFFSGLAGLTGFAALAGLEGLAFFAGLTPFFVFTIITSTLPDFFAGFMFLTGLAAFF